MKIPQPLAPGFACLLLALAPAAAAPTAIVSPNGAVAISFAAPADGPLTYSVSFRGRPVMAPSDLGYEIENQPPLAGEFRLLAAQSGEIDETYAMPTGKSNPVRNHGRTLRLELQEIAPPGRRLDLEARADDDGVAFRYILPAQPTLREVRITAERTTYNLAKEGTGYPLLLRGFRTPYEDDYHILPVAGIHPEDLIGLPFLVELPGVAWIAVTEAATPVVSPWRVILIGDDPGRLVESNLVCNLNPPCAIADTSWIKPGKTAWDWWSGDAAEGVAFKPGMNTATMEHYVDFAADSGFPYMLIDAGWAAGGDGPSFSHSDLTHTNPAIDLPAILAQAKAKGVGIWLWAHWMDIDRQAAICFPLFEKWGVAGVKIDFMERDDQWMVNFYRRIVRLAAEHHLMIDYHGAYKPDGLRRTWPNLLTRESVMGAEYNKWSARITPEHNAMLAFTRMLAGPMDYTPGGFDNVTRADFTPRWVRPEVMTTRAHALALYVVFESPLQMVSDYPEAYRNEPGFDFIRAVPTVWDETRVLGGRPEDYIALARRRGREWYVGVINTREGRSLNLALDFLGPGDFRAEIYRDARDAGRFPKHLARETRSVQASDRLDVNLASGGGEAILLRPAPTE